ncbi:MAG: class I SAM-dependent methyltransferase [Acidobacteriota bacterium]
MTKLVPASWLDPVEPGLVWSPEIQAATSLMHAVPTEQLGKPTQEQFYSRAFKEWNIFLDALESSAFNFRKAGAALEIGCGSARLIRMLRCVRGMRLVGVDINPDCVAWCKQNVPGVEFYSNRSRPPLENLLDGSFDLVIAYSVFTHISAELQLPWLMEVRRVMRPGGIFLCTMVGHNHQNQQLGVKERQQLETEGSVVLNPGDSGLSYSSQVRGLCDIFQSRHKVIENFSRVFSIVDFHPGEEINMGQDLLVLRKPAEVSSTPSALYREAASNQ